MTRARFVILALLFSLAGCGSDIPGYVHVSARRSCHVPSTIEGMERIRPTQEQVTQAWSVLDLAEGELIQYWFEDERGNTVIGVTGGTHYWRVALSVSNGLYLPNSSDWRQMELVCIG